MAESKILPAVATSHMMNAAVHAWHSWKSRDTGGNIQTLGRLMWEHMADAAPEPPPTIPADMWRRALSGPAVARFVDVNRSLTAIRSLDTLNIGDAARAALESVEAKTLDAAITELKQYLPAQEQGEKERI
jgi:hypothetical protein